MIQPNGLPLQWFYCKWSWNLAKLTNWFSAQPQLVFQLVQKVTISWYQWDRTYMYIVHCTNLFEWKSSTETADMLATCLRQKKYTQEISWYLTLIYRPSVYSMLPLKQHHDGSVGFMSVPTTLTYGCTTWLTALADPCTQLNIPTRDPSINHGTLQQEPLASAAKIFLCCS